MWFAFRLYLWHIGLQLLLQIVFCLARCDLLSDCIFDILVYSSNNCHKRNSYVVICFQIVSLTYWFTATLIFLLFDTVLWFAFRLYLWHIGLQRLSELLAVFPSCDLLSDCIFDILVYSLCNDSNYKPAVVICFQIVSLTYWFTAAISFISLNHELWFAFRLYLWHIGLQHTHWIN